MEILECDLYRDISLILVSWQVEDDKMEDGDTGEDS
jgi:hypothetical protein